MVLAHHIATRQHERAGRERRGVGRQVALEHADVVVVGDEADFYRLGLVGRDEPEPAGHDARLPLGELSHGRAQPRHDGTVDPPQKVRLVLLRVAAAVQRSVAGDHVMPGRHGSAVQRIGMVQEIAELGEGVAAHARNRGPPARVLRHEVADHVAAEPLLEIHYVVRNAERVSDELRVGDGVERATGAVGDCITVAKQLHGGADDLVPRLDEQGSRHRAVHAARHRD